jgi:WD40 repeat protein
MVSHAKLARNFPDVYTNSVSSVAFLPNGKQIVSGSSDKTIRLWDVTNAQLIESPLKGHTQEVTSVTFPPDCQQLAELTEST